MTKRWRPVMITVEVIEMLNDAREEYRSKVVKSSRHIPYYEVIERMYLKYIDRI